VLDGIHIGVVAVPIVDFDMTGIDAVLGAEFLYSVD
jgi:hypothetical protein